jgi:hypothetical protein
VDGVSYTEPLPTEVFVVDRLGELASYNEVYGKNNVDRKDRVEFIATAMKTAVDPDKERKKGESAPESNNLDDFGDRVPTRNKGQ